MEDRSFLGSGAKFPPQVNRSTGRFAVSKGLDSVKESLYIILMTQQGERWLEPYFGSSLMSYTFMDTSVTMLSLMASDLTSAILDQEPRISDVDVQIDPHVRQGCLMVNVAFQVAGSNTAENMVFPFYLQGAAEEEAGSEQEE